MLRLTFTVRRMLIGEHRIHKSCVPFNEAWGPVLHINHNFRAAAEEAIFVDSVKTQAAFHELSCNQIHL